MNGCVAHGGMSRNKNHSSCVTCGHGDRKVSGAVEYYANFVILR